MSPEEKLSNKRAYHRKWQARWREENPVRSKEIAAKSRDKHRERLRLEGRETYYADVEKSRAYYRGKLAEKRKWIADIKMASGCVDCGYKVHASALQFDHLPQYEKCFSVGVATSSKSKQSILDEINKCEVRCANCHAIKTAERRKEH